MVDVVERLCVKTIRMMDGDNEVVVAEQGQYYTTSAEPNADGRVALFSKYWVGVDPMCFVEKEL